jgi:hypothetical protein
MELVSMHNLVSALGDLIIVSNLTTSNNKFDCVFHTIMTETTTLF